MGEPDSLLQIHGGKRELDTLPLRILHYNCFIGRNGTKKAHFRHARSSDKD